jgi:1-acyl-sn-glycerol-3-phosphate acyltransferase
VIVQRVVTAWCWVAWILIVLLGFPVVCLLFVLTAPFDPGRYVVGRFFRLMGKTAALVNPLWRFHTDGLRITDPRRPYVAVSNHESWTDIFLLCYLPWEMKWLAKQQVFNIPVMGWIMRMAGDVPLVRGNRESAVGALAKCRDRLAKRVSVMIFPEGTRSPRAEMLPFKDGAFALAIETGAPVLPIAIAGTRHAMAKGSLQVQRAVAFCRVLEPVDTAGMSLADMPALKARVRGLIDDARHAMQLELGITSPESRRPEQAAAGH